MEQLIKCPNCGKEMIRTSNRLTEIICVAWDQIDGESEYEPRTGYRYKCNYCNIKYNSLKNHWTIPKSIKPDITYKQENCIGVICKNLGIQQPHIISKFAASKFINEHLEESKKVTKERIEDYYERISDIEFEEGWDFF